MTRSASTESIVRTPRPRNRKAQIVSAAAELFASLGYHNVGTENIAEAVGITAGALYRHFRSKQELLARTLLDSFDRAEQLASERGSEDVDTLVMALAEASEARRDLGVLWNREARHLDDELRRQTRARFFDFLSFFAVKLRAERPGLTGADADLLAWCAISVLTSLSYHRTPLVPERIVELLHRMTISVCAVELPYRAAVNEGAGEPGRDDLGPGMVPGARREALLAAATRLFSTRGYQTVTVEHIGAAVGVTSTSVYRYFATKGDLLTAVVARGNEPLQLGLSRALASASTAEQGLENAVSAYLEFAFAHHDLLGVLIAEVMNLPEPHRGRLLEQQRDYVAEWFRLLAATRPELSGAEVRFRVHAVLTAVNNVARNVRLRPMAGTGDALRVVALRLLYG